MPNSSEIPDLAARLNTIDVPVWGRVMILVATAWLGGLFAIAIVALGLDYMMDRLVDFFLLERVQNGHLRLAGISAPLSEEPARLVGILLSIVGMNWWLQRNGMQPGEFELTGKVPWAWVFGMNAGLAFAIVETTLNGDPLLAILPRTLAHGTYASLIMLALALYRHDGSVWPMVAAVALALVLHGLNNSLVALDNTQVSARLLTASFSIVGVGALLAAHYQPAPFGIWTFSLTRANPSTA